MPEAEYSTTAALPVDVVWEFVQEMDNWAPFLRGYRSHEKQGLHDSVWLLKGDVGAVAREVRFDVHVEDWNPERVVFTLKGINEPMEGGGEFRLEAIGAEGAGAEPAETPRPGLFARFVRWLYRLIFGRAERAGGPDRAPAGAGGSRLTFVLRVKPGGPMGPMIDAMMKPLMLPVAEELAERIMAELERRQGGQREQGEG